MDLDSSLRNLQARSRVRFDDRAVDPFVDDMQHRVISLRIQGLLPSGRALPQVYGIECEQVAEILSPDPRSRIQCYGVEGIETDIRTGHLVVKFEIPDERCLGEDVFEIPDLAPAIVTEDDIGNESAFAQTCGALRDRLRVDDRAFRFTQVMMNLR
jgi:hypothetical protein